MRFVRIIFNLNPLNWHYLYPPFFLNTNAKEEKNASLRGHNSRKYLLGDAIYFLAALPVAYCVILKLLKWTV